MYVSGMQLKLDKNSLVSEIIAFELVARYSPCYHENTYRRQSVC